MKRPNNLALRHTNVDQDPIKACALIEMDTDLRQHDVLFNYSLLVIKERVVPFY